MTRPRIIFSDFDGSIAYTEVDQIPRRLLPHAVEVLAWIREQGNYLVLWTCRTGTRLAVALRFLHEQGIVFDAINENWPGAFPTSRKAFADFYIDDHSFPIDWLKIKAHIAAMPAPEDFTPALNQDALPPLIKHRLAVHANRLKRKPGKAPRWMYPLTVEVYYRKILLAFIAKLQAEVETKILPKVKGMLAEVGALKQDAWSADLDTLMGDFQDSFDSIFPQPKMLEALESVTYKTNTFIFFLHFPAIERQSLNQ